VSTTFLVSLAVVVTVVLAGRVLLTALPLRRAAARLSFLDAMLVIVGSVGLAFHCLAMFFRDLVEPLPGAVISDIRALGTASLIWYVVPAALVLFGLRSQHPAAVAGLATSLLAVGATMFVAGSLLVHLATIFASVLVSALIASALVLPPWVKERQPQQRQNGWPAGSA